MITKIPNSTTRFCCRHAEVRWQGLTCVQNREIHVLHHHHTSKSHTTLQSISTYRQIFLQALWSEMVEKWPCREEWSCKEERKVAIRHPSLASSSKWPVRSPKPLKSSLWSSLQLFSLNYNLGNTWGTYLICGTQLRAILVCENGIGWDPISKFSYPLPSTFSSFSSSSISTTTRRRRRTSQEEKDCVRWGP